MNGLPGIFHVVPIGSTYCSQNDWSPHPSSQNCSLSTPPPPHPTALRHRGTDEKSLPKKDPCSYNCLKQKIPGMYCMCKVLVGCQSSSVCLFVFYLFKTMWTNIARENVLLQQSFKTMNQNHYCRGLI